jgi:outer membrane protein OmpA-like peptidoglycan-associated protein
MKGLMAYLFIPAFLLPFVCFSQPGSHEPEYLPVYHAPPSQMWEIGLHGGTAFSFGDIDFVPGWGAGFHVRRAIDYVFSLRAEGCYGRLKNDDTDDGSTETNIQTGSVQLLVSLNNLSWSSASRRRVNIYGLVGGGITRFEVKARKIISSYIKPHDPTFETHADFGLGISFRLSERLNIGTEAKGLIIFGSNADLLDGVKRLERDVMSYGSVRLNCNIGNKKRKTEPLYWVNPLGAIMQDVTELKNRPVFNTTDSDGDGVIDLLDRDNSTPKGAPVDTRGVVLDSDADGIPNYKDDEPYIPAGQKGGDLPYIEDEDIRKIIENELSLREEADSSNEGLANWFLPIIHFGVDSDKIRYADYGNLASIARVMKDNPSLKLVATGFTDKTASGSYNLSLSYKRAKAAIEHLVNVNKTPRSRLILHYNGEDFPLVPTTVGSIMNRRVEFRIADENDTNMEAPIEEKGDEKRD